MAHSPLTCFWFLRRYKNRRSWTKGLTSAQSILPYNPFPCLHWAAPAGRAWFGPGNLFEWLFPLEEQAAYWGEMIYESSWNNSPVQPAVLWHIISSWRKWVKVSLKQDISWPLAPPVSLFTESGSICGEQWVDYYTGWSSGGAGQHSAHRADQGTAAIQSCVRKSYWVLFSCNVCLVKQKLPWEKSW